MTSTTTTMTTMTSSEEHRQKIIIQVEGNIVPSDMTRLMDGLKAISGFDFYIQSGIFISDYKPPQQQKQTKRKNKKRVV